VRAGIRDAAGAVDVYLGQMPGPLWLVLALAAAAAEPRAAFSVRVSPAVDPRAGGWLVQLLEESEDGRKPVDEGPVGANGTWETRAVRRGGHYRVRVATAAGEGWYADEKPFEWDGRLDTRDVRLTSSAFRARLVLGKKPLSGRVTFTDRDGLVSVPFATKTDGTFEGVLPRDGWWSVTVAADRPHFRTTFDVKVDPVFRDGTPPDVEVRVVSRTIQGEIVDLRNVRVPVASLSVSGFQEPMKVEGGWFTWDKIVDGWTRVRASVRSASGFDSSPERFVLVEGGWVDPGFVALEIRPTYILRGRAVLLSGDPAPGTRIRLLSHSYERRVAAADGRFQMTIRGGGESACLLVVDPAKAARLVRVPASETEQDAPVAESAGTLSLDLPALGTWNRFGALVANGCRLSWFLLREIPGAVIGGTTYRGNATFRASAGAYALCGISYGELEEDGEIPPEACVSGTLAPGGTLSLHLDP
jgi:hypothetical protein